MTYLILILALSIVAVILLIALPKEIRTLNSVTNKVDHLLEQELDSALEVIQSKDAEIEELLEKIKSIEDKNKNVFVTLDDVGRNFQALSKSFNKTLRVIQELHESIEETQYLFQQIQGNISELEE